MSITGNVMAAPDDLRFNRFPLFNHYALVDSGYGQGVLDGDVLGFTRGQIAMRSALAFDVGDENGEVNDLSNGYLSGFSAGAALPDTGKAAPIGSAVVRSNI